MPRNAKFTKEEVISKALEIVEAEGVERLTARSLGEKLGSSSRPIFTVFNSMEEVLAGVDELARLIYKGYIDEGLKEDIAFKGVGKSYIRFANEHPKLFQLLFMKEHAEVPDSASVLGLIDDSYQRILDSITQSYPVGTETAKELYMHMWIYSHGIAVLIANKMCRFDDAQISDMLTEIFKSLLINRLRGDKQ